MGSSVWMDRCLESYEMVYYLTLLVDYLMSVVM